MLINIVLLALYLFIAVGVGAIVGVIACAWLGDDTDDAHKPDIFPPELPPHATLEDARHIDIFG